MMACLSAEACLTENTDRVHPSELSGLTIYMFKEQTEIAVLDLDSPRSLEVILWGK